MKCGTCYPSNILYKMKFFENFTFTNFKMAAVLIFKSFISHKLLVLWNNVPLDKILSIISWTKWYLICYNAISNNRVMMENVSVSLPSNCKNNYWQIVLFVNTSKKIVKNITIYLKGENENVKYKMNTKDFKLFYLSADFSIN